MEIPPQYYRYWGETAENGGYHLLSYHCLDVAASLVDDQHDMIKGALANGK